MYRDKKIGVVVPACNEESQIERTVRTMPNWVDRIAVVDDCSRGDTSAVVQKMGGEDQRIVLIRHETNRSAGRAISTRYTALNRRALRLLPLEGIHPRSGTPNDSLVTLNICNMRVTDIPVKPIYGIGERSGLKHPHAVFCLSLLPFRLCCRRTIQKHMIRDFPPLILFCTFGVALFVPGFLFGLDLLPASIFSKTVAATSALSVVFLVVFGPRLLLFAMLFDTEANRDLKGR